MNKWEKSVSHVWEQESKWAHGMHSFYRSWMDLCCLTIIIHEQRIQNSISAQILDDSILRDRLA